MSGSFIKREQLAIAAIVIAAGAAISNSIPASAHHAFAAEFDAEKPFEIKGAVTKFKLVNPHSWLYIDVKNSDGSVTNWGVEFSAPNALAQRGLTKESIKAGDEVAIKGFLAKNGGPFGYSVFATLADGRVIQTGGAQDAPSLAGQR